MMMMMMVSLGQPYPQDLKNTRAHLKGEQMNSIMFSGILNAVDMSDVDSVTLLCSFRPPVLGPALPPGFRRAAYDDDDGEDTEGFPGPALPPGYQAEPSSSEGEDEDVIGPMPAKGPVEDSVARDIERRAQTMKEKLTRDVSL